MVRAVLPAGPRTHPAGGLPPGDLLAIDYATSLPEVDTSRVGFLGHSYGGRVAMWAPAWDDRIRASVSNCGCIPYRDSFARDDGFQREFVIPGFATR